MTGIGFYIPPINMVMTGGWFMTASFTHILAKVLGIIHEPQGRSTDRLPYFHAPQIDTMTKDGSGQFPI